MRPLFVFLVGLVIIQPAVAAANLRVGFYDTTCPQAESLVRAAVHKHVVPHIREAAWLLRLFFNDCFHTGCDASSLIVNYLPDYHPPEFVFPIVGLDGSSTIDDAKSSVEAVCPQTVSCADIMALAARDAVAIASNGTINYSVPTGRRDSLTTFPEAVVLPPANTTLADALNMFSEKNLTLEDMVTLLGAHSIGYAKCDSFRYRMFNFNGKNGTSDPNMNSVLKDVLGELCGASSARVIVGDTLYSRNLDIHLDQGTGNWLDNSYYGQLLQNMGILQLDQEMALDKSTAWLVKSYASNATFFYQKFAEALIKLGNLGVLTGDEGDIRKECYKFNNDTKHYKPKYMLLH